MNRRLDAGEQLLQLNAAFALRHAAQIPSVGREQVERDERGGRLLRQLRDARRGRMQPQLKRVEIETAGRGDHDLAVDHAAVRQAGEERRVQLGKVPVERPQVAALDEHVPAAAEHDRAKPVPFRLVQKAVAGRKLCRQLGEHRLDRRNDSKLGHGHANRKLYSAI